MTVGYTSLMVQDDSCSATEGGTVDSMRKTIGACAGDGASCQLHDVPVLGREYERYYHGAIILRS